VANGEECGGHFGVKVVALIQARVGSTRLPCKVLKDICGQTMLARVVRRTQRATSLNQVIVVTTTQPADAAIVDECERLGVASYRGSELDVLDRYYQAATHFEAGAVVRVTSDCPLIDPEIIDRVVAAFLAAMPDYASTVIHRSYPQGLDTEVMSIEALRRAWKCARQTYERVHVTPYFYQNPELFRLHSIVARGDYSNNRWTVDTPADLDFVRAVYQRLGPCDTFSWRSVLDLLSAEPALATINSEIRQKSLEEA
jgi:spore coat polysaccharide biosynthesis protein SpsF